MTELFPPEAEDILPEAIVLKGPLCRKCKHYRKDWVFAILPPWDGQTYSECASPKREMSPATGALKPSLCSIARNLSTMCGPWGAWFEPKKESTK